MSVLGPAAQEKIPSNLRISTGPHTNQGICGPLCMGQVTVLTSRVEM